MVRAQEEEQKEKRLHIGAAFFFFIFLGREAFLLSIPQFLFMALLEDFKGIYRHFFFDFCCIMRIVVLSTNTIILKLLLTLALGFYSIAPFAQEIQEINYPYSSGELMSKTDSLLEAEKYEEALKTINQVIVGDTNYLQSLLKKSVVLEQLERYDDAVKVNELGMKIDDEGELQSFWLNKGYYLNLAGKKKEALACYKSLKAHSPNYKEVYNNIAYQYLDMEAYDSSYAAYKELVVKFPYHGNGHFNLGVFAFNQGNLTEAFMAFNMVILLQPYSTQAFTSLRLLNELSRNTKLEKTPKDGF